MFDASLRSHARELMRVNSRQRRVLLGSSYSISGVCPGSIMDSRIVNWVFQCNNDNNCPRLRIGRGIKHNRRCTARRCAESLRRIYRLAILNQPTNQRTRVHALIGDQSARRTQRGMTSLTVAVALLSVTFPGIIAARVKHLEMPSVVRNGSGPVTLNCIYELKDTEMGLVVKWFHNQHELIYQWIPPMSPQVVGLIKGFAEFPEEATNRPMSHSIIRLKQITLAMDGEYTCIVSTFQEESTESTRMIVYVPETNVTIHTPMYNETHVNLTCVVFGARPRPVLMMHVEGIEVKGHSGYTAEYSENPWIRHQAIVREPEAPAMVECEIVIPHTKYQRRTGVVYYPRSHRSTTSSLLSSTVPPTSSIAPTYSTDSSSPLSSSLATSSFSTSTGISDSPRLTSQSSTPTIPTRSSDLSAASSMASEILKP